MKENREFESAESEKKGGKKETMEWEPEDEGEQMALEIASLIKPHGKVYFCGGYVRDLLLHREFGDFFEPKDIDLATELPLEQTEEYLKAGGFSTKLVGEQFSVIKAWRGDSEGKAVDVATFREETEYKDGRHPEKVILIRDPEKDAERRDFTVNAIFFDPFTREVIDYVGGLEDLRKKILRPVGNVKERFREDYLRMIRYVRFRAKCGFRFSQEVKQIIQSEAHKILDIPYERIFPELDAMMKLPKSWVAVGDLGRLGLLKHLLPEVWMLRGVMHPKADYHKEGSVYRHTLEALRSFTRKEYVLRMRRALNLDSTLDTKEVWYRFFKHFGSDIGWAVLFHDLGKRTRQQRRILPNGETRLTFKEHELDSRDMAAVIADRMRFSRDKKGKIMWLVERHLMPRDIPRMRLSRKRAFLQDSRIEELLFVALADEMGNLPAGTEGFDGAWSELEKERARPPEPKDLVDGKRLMVEFDLKPGPAVGKLKAAIREAQLEEKIHSEEEAIQYAKEHFQDFLQ